MGALLATLMVVAGSTATAGPENCRAQPDPGALMAGRNLIYVAPDGNDGGNGSQEAPLASFGAARDTARASAGEDTIVVRGGDYFLSDPVPFDQSDSGLRIVAMPGESPVLHGGVRVEGWQPGEGGLWAAPLALPDGWAVWGLFVDGARQVPARFPNLPADGTVRDGWLFADTPLPAMQLNQQFRFRQGDLPDLADYSGLVVHIVGGYRPGSQWGSDTLPVQSVDRGNRIVTTGGTSYFFTGEGSRYFLEGRGELLDAPGEWWYNSTDDRLYYRPVDPDFAAKPVTIAFIGTFFDITGAQDMTIAGLEFRDGAVVGTGKYGTDTRGYGAVRLTHADRAQILNNRFANMGVAVHVAESSDVTIAGNDIAHIAGNGIYLGTNYGSFGRSDRATVVENRIREVGEVYFESAGIWFQATDGARIEHNLVDGAAQFGIAGGSLWGDQDASHDGVIRNNIVRNTNRQTADGGAIKLMGAQMDRQGIRIEGNLVTGTDELMNRTDGSFWPAHYEDTLEWPGPISWAIYMDEKASGNEIVNNLLIGNVAGIGINGGWANTVRGNVILEGAGTAFRIDDSTGRDWRPDWAAPNLIEGNVVGISRPDGRAVDIIVPTHGMDFVHFADNRYLGTLTDQSVRSSPPIMRSGQFGSLERFRAAGQDLPVSVATPGGTAAMAPVCLRICGTEACATVEELSAAGLGPNAGNALLACLGPPDDC